MVQHKQKTVDDTLFLQQHKNYQNMTGFENKILSDPLYTILSLSSVLPVAINKFPKCVEQSVKVTYNNKKFIQILKCQVIKKSSICHHNDNKLPEDMNKSNS
jgi:hypothetical protein